MWPTLLITTLFKYSDRRKLVICGNLSKKEIREYKLEGYEKEQPLVPNIIQNKHGIAVDNWRKHSWNKSRKVTVSITLKANEKRNLANVIVDTKSTLVPAVGVETELIIDYTSDGQVTGAELKSGIPGQSYIDTNGQILDDKGIPLAAEEPVKSKVVQFK